MHPKRAFVLLSCAAFCLATASTSQIDKAIAQSKGDQMQGSATVGGQITSGAGQAASQSKANAEKAEKESQSSQSQVDMMKVQQAKDKQKKAMEMLKKVQQQQQNANQKINQNK